MELSSIPDPDPRFPFPLGPALLYVPSPGTGIGLSLPDDVPAVWRVDAGTIAGGGTLDHDEARRERMILRALLNQALYLLGPEEDEG